MITRDWLTMTTLAFVAAFQGVMVTVTNVVKVDIDGLTITLYFTRSLMQSNAEAQKPKTFRTAAFYAQKLSGRSA